MSAFTASPMPCWGNGRACRLRGAEEVSTKSGTGLRCQGRATVKTVPTKAAKVGGRQMPDSATAGVDPAAAVSQSPMSGTSRQMVSIEQAAQLLGCGEEMVRLYLKKGMLKGRKKPGGRGWEAVTLDSMNALLASCPRSGEGRRQPKAAAYPNLKLQIFNRGVRQKDLAKQIGIRDTALSKIINGWCEPNRKEKKLLTACLEADESWLFDKQQPPLGED